MIDLDFITGIPAEAVSQWRDSRRWDRDIYQIVPDGNHQSLIVDPDYVMWTRLGLITDALLFVIATAVVFLALALVGSLL